MLPRTWRLAILNWLGAGYMTINKDEDFEETSIGIDSMAPEIDVTGLSFNVMSAQGGTIVQLRKYDDKLNRNNYSTHIIAEGQDVAENIGKIVAIELWKA
jgi:hypothetical protein